MAVYFPDILENANPQYPLLDGKFLKGTAYPIGDLSETGSTAMLNRQELGAIVFVTSSQQYYAFYGQSTSSVDWNNAANWKILGSGSGGGGTVTGTGTVNTLALWSGSTALSSSVIYQTGSSLLINTQFYDYYTLDVSGSARVLTNLVVGPVYTGSILVDRNYGLRVNTAMSGALTVFGVVADGEIQSGTTNAAYYFRSFGKFAATSSTLGTMYHFSATQTNALGSGSTIGTQVGYWANSSLISASSNWGFLGDLPASSSGGTPKNWNLYMQGDAPNYMAGALQIGPNTLGTSTIRIGRSIPSASVVINSDGALLTGSTSGVTNYQSGLRTAASSLALASFVHFKAVQASIGAGTSVSSQTAFLVDNTLTSTNNFGFRGQIPAGASNWNLYMEGGAPNFLSGSLVIGTTTSQGYKLQVSGSGNFTSGLTVTGSFAVASGSTEFQVLDTGIKIGNLITDVHTVTGSINISGSLNATSSQALTASNIQGGGQGYLPLWNTNTSLTSSTVYQNSGNIGIGTSSPTKLLDIAGDTIVSSGSLFISSSTIYYGIANYPPFNPLPLKIIQTQLTADPNNDAGMIIGANNIVPTASFAIVMGGQNQSYTAGVHTVIGHQNYITGSAVSSTGQITMLGWRNKVSGSNRNGGDPGAGHILLGQRNISDSYSFGQNTSILIGQDNNTNGYFGNGMIGTGLKYYANRQLLFGTNATNVDSSLKEVWFGRGVVNEVNYYDSENGAGSSVSINVSKAYSGSDATYLPNTSKPGGNLTLNGGQGTGTGSAGDVIIGTPITGSSNNTTHHVQTNRVWVKGHTGYVGIGTSTPSGSLHVSGTVYLPSLTNSSTANKVILIDTNGQLFTTSSSALGGGNTFELTAGNGTTANGTAVDLGGTLTGDVQIDGSSSKYGFSFGLPNNELGNFRVDASTIALQPPGGPSISLGAQGLTINNLQELPTGSEYKVVLISGSGQIYTTASSAFGGGSTTAAPTYLIVTGSVTASVNTVTGSIFSVISGSARLLAVSGSGALILSSSTAASGRITIEPTNGTVTSPSFDILASSSTLRLRTNTANSLLLGTNGFDRWYIEPTGELTAATDNAHDIGLSGSRRPRNIYAAGTGSVFGAAAVSRSLSVSGTLTVGNNTRAVGDYSYAGGLSTIASGSGQTVVGQYNKHSNTTDLFVVGGGDADNNRKDILAVSTVGIKITGSLRVNNLTNSSNTNTVLYNSSTGEFSYQESTYVPSAGTPYYGTFYIPAIIGGGYAIPTSGATYVPTFTRKVAANGITTGSTGQHFQIENTGTYTITISGGVSAARTTALSGVYQFYGYLQEWSTFYGDWIPIVDSTYSFIPIQMTFPPYTAGTDSYAQFSRTIMYDYSGYQQNGQVRFTLQPIQTDSNQVILSGTNITFTCIRPYTTYAP